MDNKTDKIRRHIIIIIPNKGRERAIIIVNRAIIKVLFLDFVGRVDRKF